MASSFGHNVPRFFRSERRDCPLRDGAKGFRGLRIIIASRVITFAPCFTSRLPGGRICKILCRGRSFLNNLGNWRGQILWVQLKRDVPVMNYVPLKGVRRGSRTWRKVWIAHRRKGWKRELGLILGVGWMNDGFEDCRRLMLIVEHKVFAVCRSIRYSIIALCTIVSFLSLLLRALLIFQKITWNFLFDQATIRSLKIWRIKLYLTIYANYRYLFKAVNC